MKWERHHTPSMRIGKKAREDGSKCTGNKGSHCDENQKVRPGLIKKRSSKSTVEHFFFAKCVLCLNLRHKRSAGRGAAFFHAEECYNFVCLGSDSAIDPRVRHS